MSRGWIGVDFDGTLAEHQHGTGDLTLGKPIDLMVRRVRRWLDAGYEVRILTARVCSLSTPEVIGEQINLVQAWCVQHLGRALEVTAEKDFHMWLLFDDRAVAVTPNFGSVGAYNVPKELL